MVRTNQHVFKVVVGVEGQMSRLITAQACTTGADGLGDKTVCLRMT